MEIKKGALVLIGDLTGKRDNPPSTCIGVVTITHSLLSPSDPYQFSVVTKGGNIWVQEDEMIFLAQTKQGEERLSTHEISQVNFLQRYLVEIIITFAKRIRELEGMGDISMEAAIDLQRDIQMDRMISEV